jgi:integrase/recombinase XerD
MHLPQPPPINPNIQFALAYLLQAFTEVGQTKFVSHAEPVPYTATMETPPTAASADPALINGDPDPEVRDPRPRRRKRTLPQVLSRAEMEALLAAPNLQAPSGLRDRCVLELMYRAGLRVGEVVALTPRDVDLELGEVRIIAGKGGDGTSYFPTKLVSPLIDEWKRTRSRLGLASSIRLFCTIRAGHSTEGDPTQPGSPVSVRAIEAMIKRRAKKAGLDPAKVTPHVLRHTFATELLEQQNCTIRDVQDALRHKNLDTTMIYTHVRNVDLRAKIQQREE